MIKHIGIVACSYEGAALCYRIICQEASKLMGQYNHPEITMHTHPFNKYMECIDRNDWDGIANLMVESAKKLAACGSEFAITPDNTIHRVLNKVKGNSPIPWISIIDAVGREIKRRGFTKVGLLGTIYTMQGPVYPDALKKMGIDVIIPSKEDQEMINQVIFDELVYGIISNSSRQRYLMVIEKLKEKGCEGVILGCTEIPLLIAQEGSPLPVFDSTKLLAKEALNFSLTQDPSKIIDPDEHGRHFR